MANAKKYFLGLDVGTNSVGWAVTDENYNLIKKSGKHLWGARLFGDASTAAERRSYREGRRRLQRRRWRVALLQDMFSNEINRIDPFFFDRLNNSSLLKEDKPENAKAPFLLFNETKFTDRDFYKQYPTIYHLRKALLDSDERFDIRMVYLALVHMIKYRGNFLLEGELSASNENESLRSNFESINACISNLNEENDDSQNLFDLSLLDFNKLIETFKATNKKKDLSDALCQMFQLKHTSSDIRALIIDMICGSIVSIVKLLPNLDQVEDEEFKKTKIDFTSDSFETDVLPKLTEKVDDNQLTIILSAHSIYNFRVLTNLLQGKQYLSDAMIALYDSHKNQLQIIKHLIKTYSPDNYHAFFKELTVKDFNHAKETIDNYASYVGFNKKTSTKHATSNDNLVAALRKITPFNIEDKDIDGFAWKSESDKEDYKKIKNAIAEHKFLPRQNSKDNGVIPHQLNEIEMRIILEKQGKYYPFLLEKAPSYANPNEEDYKIVSILKFKIPYFVGPLTRRTGTDKPQHQWAVFNSDEKITPWNFHDVVDEKTSAEHFIERMKNSCTYLIGEPTLPKNSLLYSKFVLLNEINNWVINGSPISLEDKDYLINNLYLKKKTVTITDIERTLKQKYNNAVIHITTKAGKDLKAEDIHANLKPFIDMMNDNAFGPALLTDKKSFETAEEIINLLTILEDKNLIKEKLSALGLSKNQLNFVKSLKYTGWGKLSKKVLSDLKSEVVDETGEVYDASIIDLMANSNLNFMEILETKDRFSFRKQIDELNNVDEMTPYELIDKEYASPAMKRAIRQTFRVIDELKQILSIDGFDSYFVETTREEEKEKKRTRSRKEQLQDYYNAAKQFVSEELQEQLSRQTDDNLRKKKIFLYFTQLGKSVYSGKPIDLDRLDKDYDIDHIIPQAKIKDDSINNIVLVEREINNKKQDNYPIPSDCITEEGKNWVKVLNSIKSKKESTKLFSDEKAKKILRTPNNPLTDDELVGFVNRQLTLANQSIKAITDILKVVDPHANIIYSKATLVSDFRKAFGFSKCREVNDFHHANDAYLNIVVGNTYNKVFTSNFNKQVLQNRREHFEQTKINPYNFFARNQMIYNTPAYVWKANKYFKDENGNIHEEVVKDSSMEIVKKMMSYNDPLVTQMLYTQPGFMNKTSIVSKRNTTKASSIPLKAGQSMEKYGGYSDLTTPYFILVRSEGKKGKHIYSLESIPTMIISSMTKEEKLKYLTEHNGLKNPEIIKDKVLIRSVLKVPGPDNSYSVVGISGKGDNRVSVINLSELKIPFKYYQYISAISHLILNSSNELLPHLERFDNSLSIKRNGVELSKEKNLDYFNYLCNNVFTRQCYNSLPELASALKAIKEKESEFVALSFSNQLLTLLNLVKLVNCKKANTDLSLLGFSKTTGNIRVNKKLTVGTQLIQQSITGFYSKVIFEVPED